MSWYGYKHRLSYWSLLVYLDQVAFGLSALCKSQVSIFAHYLIPCGVEYSLIACAIFYKMFRRVGHITIPGNALQCSKSPCAPHEETRSAHEYPSRYPALTVVNKILTNIWLYKSKKITTLLQCRRQSRR